MLLCGGKGTRLEGMDLPKPLCTVKGRSLLWHVLDGLPKEIQKVTLFYSEALNACQFERVVKHSCHGMQAIRFQPIPLETRGPVETGYVGLHRANFDEEKPILFIDNDTITTFSLSSIPKDSLSLGYHTTTDRSKPYCFLEMDEATKQVTAIKEKHGISNTYSVGLYYFPSVRRFKALCDELFRTQVTQNEYFLSDLYALALQQGEEVAGFPCEDTVALGTHADILENIHRVKCQPMRICFDIDNTILTYSDSIGSTRDIRPIPKMVEIIKKLHRDGHTIVLHTARGMKSCDSNLGRATKKSMLNVLETLNTYDIPYDELYFGKPWADLYVDDRAWNPYTNPNFSEFLFQYRPDMTRLPIVKGCSNNENSLHCRGGVLTKNGPTSSLEGEIYFYKMIQGTKLSAACPAFLSEDVTTSATATTSFDMEYIKGKTISTLFRNGLLTKGILQAVFQSLAVFHGAHPLEKDGEVTREDILENYLGKLNERAASHPHYNLPRLGEIVEVINRVIRGAVTDPAFQITNVVHGDPWFDNMMYDCRSQRVKLLDMKGKMGSVLSLKGDKMTDYAKVYQSILGFDYALYNEEYPVEYERKCRAWLEECLPVSLEDPIFEAVTGCCILKTFSYFSSTAPIPAIYKTLGKLKLFAHLF